MNIRAIVSRPLCLLLCASLWACASAPKPAGFAGDRLSGRLSVQAAQGGTAQGGAAAFELQGTAESGQLELSTPLGTLAARASWQPGQALLQRSDAETRYENLDALTRDLLGEPVPVAAMFDWLKGRPWAGAPSRPRTDGIAGFRQLGWMVDLEHHHEGLISAHRTEPTEVRLRARLDPPDAR